jgi:multicomponent Na+:H+ antiporter subunit E
MKLLRPAILFIALFGFWFLLSQKTQWLFLIIGVATALPLTWLAIRLLDTVRDPKADPKALNLPALVVYVAWLFLQIPPAAVAIARTVLTPGRNPKPAVITFNTGLRSATARTILANSITLVPGTMTLDVDGPTFVVHAFDPEHAADLIDGSLQGRIARIFGYEPDEPPGVTWMPLNDIAAKDPS